MRKAIVAVVVAGALSAVIPALASGASSPRCGGTYTPTCRPPHLTFKTPGAACVKMGPTYKLPTLTFTSIAGIRRIRIVLGSKVLFNKRFSGEGPTQYTLKGRSVPTHGLAHGGHVVTITVTDIVGKSVSRKLRFVICKAAPVFTG